MAVAKSLRLVQQTTRPPKGPTGPSLGQILLESGAVAPGDLVKALAIQGRDTGRLGSILLAYGMVKPRALIEAQSRQWAARIVDLDHEAPDPRLLDRLGLAQALQGGLLPWRRVGDTTVIATSRPEDFAAQGPSLRAAFGPVALALAPEDALRRALLVLRGAALKQAAETTVTAEESCRLWDGGTIARRGALAGGAALVAGLVWPKAALLVVMGWAVLTLVATLVLKLAATWAVLRRNDPEEPGTRIARLPVVSVLVPLFHETDIAARLVERLGRLTYPRELLDVLLVVEQEDRMTRAALEHSSLPAWIRVIPVPPGRLKTKPRALNFALNFARGSIVGIYDAEDAPDPDQIHRIVQRFHERGPEVACLQGVLDFYNTGTNWLSRCFAVEYATWFRLVLPGMQRLRLPIPLGGTTLFFRRAALEALGGWDAHNVTEDADLGLRLARHGYRAEVLDTVTQEEACCKVGPWIRQRSRWLKGYAMTYAVHMRDPALLWRQLGTRGFLGVQLLFLGTLSQYLLAPVLWSFWLLAAGLPHPLGTVLPGGALAGLGALFVTCEILNIAVGMTALRGRRHIGLRFWVPTLQLYFPLGALAAYKALYELVQRPFFWDKTEHGRHDSLPLPS